MSEKALVLSSNYTKCPFEIGTLKALKELGVDITAVCASYAGAINAALVAQGDFMRMTQFWVNANLKRIFDIELLISQKYSEEWSNLGQRTFTKIFWDFVSSHNEQLEPLVEHLKVYIDEKAIRNSHVKLSFLGLPHGSLEAKIITINDIPRGKLVQYLVAATCFPQVSALLNGTTAQEAKQEESLFTFLMKNGYNQIITTVDLEKIPNLEGVNLKIVTPSIAIGMDDQTDRKVLKKHIMLGYLDALRAYGYITGKKYFIDNKRISFVREKLKSNVVGTSQNAHVYAMISLLLGKRPTSPTMLLNMLRELQGYTSLKNQEIFGALIENAAGMLEVRKDIRYTYDELAREVLDALNKQMPFAKQAFKEPGAIQHLIAEATHPTNTVASKDTLCQYFTLLLATNPTSFHKFKNFFALLSPQTTFGLIGLIYLCM